MSISYIYYNLVTRLGAESRKPETKGIASAILTRLKKRPDEIRYIRHPATLDGGDVLKVLQNDVIYIGLSGRTNQEGIDQFENFVRPLGVKVVSVPISKVLHLKSAVTALPQGTIIGYEPLINDAAMEALLLLRKGSAALPAAECEGKSDKKTSSNFLSMPEEQGAHVVMLGQNYLLMSNKAPKSAELLRSMGYAPVLVDISEYEKLEGCVTCLSVRHRI
jgi:dimethylargininase